MSPYHLVEQYRNTRSLKVFAVFSLPEVFSDSRLKHSSLRYRVVKTRQTAACQDQQTNNSVHRGCDIAYGPLKDWKILCHHSG
jgi:hypothetical protein